MVDPADYDLTGYDTDQRPTSNIRLPPELYDTIISSVKDVRDLGRIRLSNSMMRDIASRYLYRRMHLRDFRTAIDLCLFLLKKPSVATYVIHLELHFGEVPDWIVHQWPHPILFAYTFAPAYCRVIFRALRLMTNLKHLTFKNVSPLGSRPSKNLARSNLQLTSLDLPTSVFENVILKSQPLIEDLVLSDGPSFFLPRLPASALRRLTRLASFIKDASYLIPGRSVTQFRTLEALLEEDVPACLSILSQSIGPLRHIKLMLMTINKQFFITASVCIPNIVDLVLHCMEKVEFLVTQDIVTPECLAALGNLHLLTNLEIHSYYDRPAPRYLPPIVQIGRGCPSLATFTIVDELRGNSDRTRLPASQFYRSVAGVANPAAVVWEVQGGIARTPAPRAGQQVSLIEWVE